MPKTKPEVIHLIDPDDLTHTLCGLLVGTRGVRTLGAVLMNVCYRCKAMQFERAYYGQLKGMTITNAGLTPKGTPYFTVAESILPNGNPKGVSTIFVQCDPEGNGPGHLEGLPRPKVEGL